MRAERPSASRSGRVLRASREPPGSSSHGARRLPRTFFRCDRFHAPCASQLRYAAAALLGRRIASYVNIRPPLVVNQAASNPDPLSAADRDELRLLYQTSVSDIAFFKQQQFTITNYALTLQAGLLFVAYQVLKPPPLQPFALWSLLFLVCAVSAAGLLVIARLHASIEARRQRLSRVRAHFGRAFVDAWFVPKEADDFRWLLVCVLLVSAPISASLVIARA